MASAQDTMIGSQSLDAYSVRAARELLYLFSSFNLEPHDTGASNILPPDERALIGWLSRRFKVVYNAATIEAQQRELKRGEKEVGLADEQE